MSLSRYQLIQEIGHGLGDTIYLANDTTLNRKVTIKMFRNDTASSASSDLLAQEAHKIKGLVHPNIAEIYDICTQDNNEFYMVEQYIPGLPLNEWLAPKQGVAIPTFEQRLQVFTDVLRAVKFAHDSGVLHLNLKPSNIIITDNLQPKLLDFILPCARRVSPGDSVPSLNGVSLYTAPEQINDPNKVNKSTDIFSLGVIFYEMLTGRVPYRSAKPERLAHEILSVKPIPVSRCNSAIPSAYDDILGRMLAKKHHERYSNVRQVLQDLFQVQNNNSDTPGPDVSEQKRLQVSNILASLSKSYLSDTESEASANSVNVSSGTRYSSANGFARQASNNNANKRPTSERRDKMVMPPAFRPLGNNSTIMPSPSTRYCVIQRQDSLSLYRATDLLWTRNIKDLISLCFVSDNGDVYYRTKLGLFKASSSIKAKPKTISWDHDLVNIFNSEIAIKKMKLNDQGCDVVIEVLGPPPADTSLWKRLFFTTDKARVTPHHLLYAIRDGGDHPFLVFNTPASPDGTFFWDASPSFTYLVVAIWGKNSRYHFNLYSHLNHERVGDFNLPPCTVHSVKVSDEGRITMHVTALSGESSIIVRERNGKSTNCALPKNSTVLYVGLDTFCYTHGNEIIQKHFSGQIMSNGDTTPLEQFKINYKFAFDRKGNLSLLMCNTIDMWILPIEPTHLDMAAKRWQRILSMRQDYEQEVLTVETRQEEAQKIKRERYEEVRGQLDQSLNSILNKRLHRELELRTKEGITKENVNRAVCDALQFTNINKKTTNVPTPARLEISSAKNSTLSAPSATNSAPSGLITNLPITRSQEAIEADIKKLCELNQAGRISPQGYMNQLSILSDELLKLHQ